MSEIGTSRPPREGARVLVVDDEPVMRHAMAEQLRDEGYLVEEAGNGAVALEQAIWFKPEVVVFDYAMPVFDGPALVEALRLNVRPMPALVGVSALAESKLWCADHGIPIFVMKPFEASTFLRAVDSALKLAREAQNPAPKTGSGTRASIRSACVVAVGDLHGEEVLHELLPEALRHARVVVVDNPDEAEHVLEMIVPDLLVLDDASANDRLRALATLKAIPLLLRPAAISEARLQVLDAAAKKASPSDH